MLRYPYGELWAAAVCCASRAVVRISARRVRRVCRGTHVGAPRVRAVRRVCICAVCLRVVCAALRRAPSYASARAVCAACAVGAPRVPCVPRARARAVRRVRVRVCLCRVFAPCFCAVCLRRVFAPCACAVCLCRVFAPCVLRRVFASCVCAVCLCCVCVVCAARAPSMPKASRACHAPCRACRLPSDRRWIAAVQRYDSCARELGVHIAARKVQMPSAHRKMTPVGFEPTQLALVELESTPLDHSGKVSLRHFPRSCMKDLSHIFWSCSTVSLYPSHLAIIQRSGAVASVLGP